MMCSYSIEGSLYNCTYMYTSYVDGTSVMSRPIRAKVLKRIWRSSVDWTPERMIDTCQS